jgi:hypothetical protein
MLLSKATYKKYICQKKEKQQYIMKDVDRNNCLALTIAKLTLALFVATSTINSEYVFTFHVNSRSPLLMLTLLSPSGFPVCDAWLEEAQGL